ncbi:hypothetical protein AGMMS50284_4540 [Clostridia bacterium]|nr:hypothetical protein AGMMS50284_4540 [Clostridia bacterium]
MRGYFSYFADDNAGKLALFKEEDKEIWKIDRKDSPIFKLIDYYSNTTAKGQEHYTLDL